MANLDRAIHDAARKGDAALVRKLLAQGASVDARDPNDFPVLQTAASHGHWPVCAVLLEAGAAVDATTKHGWTALMSAAEQGHEELVRELVAAGADPKRVNTGNDNALEGAVRNGHLGVITYLLDAGARPYPQLLSRLEIAKRDLASSERWVREAAARKIEILRLLRERWPEQKAAIDAMLRRAAPTKKEKVPKLAGAAVKRAGWAKAVRREIGTTVKGRHERLRRLALGVLARPEAVAHPEWPALVTSIIDLTQSYADLTEEIYGERLSPERIDEDEGSVPEMYLEEELHTIDLVLELLARPAPIAHRRWPALVRHVCEVKRAAVGSLSVGDEQAQDLFAVPAAKKHPAIKELRKLARRAFGQ